MTTTYLNRETGKYFFPLNVPLIKVAFFGKFPFSAIEKLLTLAKKGYNMSTMWLLSTRTIAEFTCL